MWKRITSAIYPNLGAFSSALESSSLSEKRLSHNSLSPLRTVSTTAGQQNVDSLLSPSERVLNACAEDNLISMRQIIERGEKFSVLDDPLKHKMLIVAAHSRSFGVLQYLLGSLPILEMDLELHQAAFDGGYEIYHIFLQVYPEMKNSEINDMGGPIPRAVLENNAMILQFLLKQGFGQDCLQKLKQLPTAHSLQDVDQEIVNLLKDHGLSLEGTNAPPAYHSSPDLPFQEMPEQKKQTETQRRINTAISNKRPSILHYILTQHPKFEVEYNTYRDSFNAGQEIFKVLIELRPDLLNQHWAIGHMGQVLGIAVFFGDYEYTKFLLEKGADPNRSYTIGGSSVLACAISCKTKLEIIQILKDYGATMKGKGNLG